MAGLRSGIFCIIPLRRSLTIDSSVDAKRALCFFRYCDDNLVHIIKIPRKYYN